MTDNLIDYKTLCENYSKEVGCFTTFDGSCIKERCFTYKLLQQCEELKNFHINLVGVKECEIKELLKLKQTLTEIKEIAERGFKHSQCNCGAKADLDLILQKNSECEGSDG